MLLLREVLDNSKALFPSFPPALPFPPPPSLPLLPQLSPKRHFLSFVCQNWSWRTAFKILNQVLFYTLLSKLTNCIFAVFFQVQKVYHKLSTSVAHYVTTSPTVTKSTKRFRSFPGNPNDNWIAKHARFKNIIKLLDPCKSQTTKVCSERNRGNVGKVFI